MTGNEFWALYDTLLSLKSVVERSREIEVSRESFLQRLKSSPSYMATAEVNGKVCPLSIVHQKTNICSVTMFPPNQLFAGDILYAFGEEWLTVETQTDEYGLVTGTAWLCNHELVFQTSDGKQHTRSAVVDAGTYYKSSEDRLPVVNGEYTLYLPMDEETSKLHVDKRLALGITYSVTGQKELETYKITGIDRKGQNLGRGSHLVVVKVERCLYDMAKDNLELSLCDYITPSEPSSAGAIEGCAQAKIGTQTSYFIKGRDSYKWTLKPILGVSYIVNENGRGITLILALDTSLIGAKIKLAAQSLTGQGEVQEKIVEVVALG